MRLVQQGPALLLPALLSLSLACSSGAPDESAYARGPSMKIATLPPAAQAAIYAAAVGAAFDPDPSLVLLAHPRQLPRTPGYDGGDSLPSAVLSALRSRGVVSGTCDPKHEVARDTPRCPGTRVGYVIRASPIFQAGKDTLQMHLAAEEFAAESGQRPVALRFEKVYQLLGSGTQWRVVREARVKEPTRY